MNTREHILHTALKLYNAGGTDAVTVRHIAAEMGISHGNLCYHFPNTHAIVRELYLGLVKKMDALVATAMTLQPQDLGVASLVQSARLAFEIFYEYRFIMLDFSRIMRNDTWIGDHYRELVNGRRFVFETVFSVMEKTGLIRPERVAGEFSMIIELQLVCGDFWMPRAEIMHRLKKDELINYYLRVWLAALPGLLTEAGIKQWNAVFEPEPVKTKKSKSVKSLKK